MSHKNYAERIGEAFVNMPVLNDVKAVKAFYPSYASVGIENHPVFGQSAIGDCLRKQWYDYFRFPKDEQVNLSSIGRSDIGNWIHDGFASKLVRSQMGTKLEVIRVEHSFYLPDHNISGRTDLLCYDHKINRYVVLELKTINAEYGANGSTTQSKGPKEDYVLQGMCYKIAYKELDPIIYILFIDLMVSPRVQWLFGSELEFGTDDCPVIANTGFDRVVYKELTINKMLKRWNELQGYIAAKQLPPADYKIKYTEEEWVGLYKADLLSYAKEGTIISKWLKDGANPGQLEMPYGKGHKECSWCPFTKICKENISYNPEKCPSGEELTRFSKAYNGNQESENVTHRQTIQQNISNII